MASVENSENPVIKTLIRGQSLQDLGPIRKTAVFEYIARVFLARVI